MKKMILGVALAVLVASPALAQATRQLRQTPEYTGQRILPGNQASQNGYQNGYAQDGYAHYGYAPGVVNGGRIVGQDPDPNVQLQLKRDPVADY